MKYKKVSDMVASKKRTNGHSGHYAVQSKTENNDFSTITFRLIGQGTSLRLSTFSYYSRNQKMSVAAQKTIQSVTSPNNPFFSKYVINAVISHKTAS
jgi:hypothetical protein